MTPSQRIILKAILPAMQELIPGLTQNRLEEIIQVENEGSSEISGQQRLFTYDEVAAILKVSKQTVRRAVDRLEITPVFIGTKTPRFTKEMLEQMGCQ